MPFPGKGVSFQEERGDEGGEAERGGRMRARRSAGVSAAIHDHAASAARVAITTTMMIMTTPSGTRAGRCGLPPWRSFSQAV
ncbi:hypothetical protein SAMN04489764_1934 [Thermostaphylospora chromogena]|uniref:Uncharacterized protein n=1 Tax=Thermostaphylospora chromogena TaxID=35622 RepID=A0A1H1DC94_9ACTN|nr:hypothetical protein SAMN04489764_1934 [Thermostaphylospora chromogena]